MIRVRRGGFSIAELSVVIVVVGILFAVVIVSYAGISKRAEGVAAQSDLDTISTQLELYYRDHGKFPSSYDSDGCPMDSEGTVDTNYCAKTGSDVSLHYTPGPGATIQSYRMEGH